MAVIEAGSFRMGSENDEALRASDGREGPVRQISITQRFALARHEVTVGEFKRFVADTGYLSTAEQPGAEAGCMGWQTSTARFARQASASWRKTGFEQDDQHPVVCVSWHDAQAFVRWLSQRSGHTYRLPSEAEWEYAARAGTATGQAWPNEGGAASQACNYGNFADQTVGPADYRWSDKHACSDGYFFTAPVGHYLPNAFGLHDMLGNVWEWVQDCYDKAAYANAAVPTDGSAYEVPDCPARGVRGGSWFSGPARSRFAYRGGYGPDSRFDLYGFRVARSLP